VVENFLPDLDPEDPRENIVLFLTDGLPTDETPSRILTLREQLGPKTKVYILAMYDGNEDPTLLQSPLYLNLKAAFLGKQSWATKADNPDKYSKTDAGFERYWADLIAAPNTIADKVLRVANAADLSSEVDAILKATTTCVPAPR
jgi:hypothetical protein